MAVRKLQPRETDEQRRARERAAPVLRARKAQAPTSDHNDELEAIAESAGVPFADVYEAWSERAGIRQYDAGVTRLQAERDAVDDVRAMYPTRRKGLAI